MWPLIGWSCCGGWPTVQSSWTALIESQRVIQCIQNRGRHGIVGTGMELGLGKVKGRSWGYVWSQCIVWNSQTIINMFTLTIKESCCSLGKKQTSTLQTLTIHSHWERATRRQGAENNIFQGFIKVWSIHIGQTIWKNISILKIKITKLLNFFKTSL